MRGDVSELHRRAFRWPSRQFCLGDELLLDAGFPRILLTERLSR